MTPTDGAPAGPYGPPSDDPLANRLFPPLSGSVRWGLDRMERILATLDAPHRCAPSLHVGGTNGKGSVARIWAEVLRAEGLRVGLYTSPHIVSFRERILVDGAPLPDRVLEEIADEIRPALVRFAPSFFEASTVLAFCAFERAGVDVMVVEVGLGGRLDATNVVDPVLTAITNVSLEHEEFLGDSLEAIAREKSGILKPGVPAWTAVRDPGVLRVLAEQAAALGTPLNRVAPPSGRWDRHGLQLQLATRRWGELTLRSPLTGEYQLHNVALAVRALESLPPRLLPTPDQIREGVLRARIPGRFEVSDDPPREWILDVAHNRAGIEALGSALHTLRPEKPVIAVVGILADKEWESMLRTLAGRVDRVVLTTPPGVPESRRWDPRAVADRLSELELLVVDPIEAAFARAVELTGKGGTVVVTGSTHTVGAALKYRDRIPAEALPPSDEFE